MRRAREPRGVLPRDSPVSVGGQGEVAAVYERCSARLVAVLCAIGAPRADAEEVVQDAFVKLLGRWDRVRDYDDPEAWVRGVAVRMLVSRHRRRVVAGRGLGRLAARTVDVPPLSPDSVAVALALRSLAPGHRAVVVLHHVLDLPLEQVARELDLPVGTVKSRLSRARAALAPHLTEEEVPDRA